MPEPVLLPERIYGLSVADGRRTVRPGEVVAFRFRAKNGSDVATPAAHLVLLLPPGWSAHDPLEAAIPAVAPGAEYVVAFRARADVADATTAHSAVQAALGLDAVILGSNVVRMRVFGHPQFCGPASGIRIDAVHPGSLRVTVNVVNEGDAAATGVRVVVPPPPGFAADEAAVVACSDELAVGAALTFAYTMVPEGPAAAVVRIDDAYVAYDGGRVTLATGATALLGPELAPPAIEAERRAGRLDLRIRIANAGWVAARGVGCALELPSGWRVLRGTMRVDGAPPAIRRDGDGEAGVALELPLVPARGAVEISVVASAARPRVEGDVSVRCGGHMVTLAIPEAERRALRLDARPESAFAEPGTVVPVAIDLHNIGETAERVTVTLDGEDCWSGELRAGAAAACVARLRVPAHLGDGDPLPVALAATGADGERLAGAQFELRVVDRPWIAVERIVAGSGRTRVTIRNVGATAARDLRLDGERAILVPVLAPGASHDIELPPAAARRAALVGRDGRVVPIGWGDRERPVDVAARLDAAAGARSGERLDVRLCVTGAGAVESLRIRPRLHPAAAYVAGSTTVNGFAVVDGVDGPALFSGGGLALYDVPAGTGVDVGWSVLPRAAGELPLEVELEANGVAVAVEPRSVAVAAAPPFGARPGALPFHIDAPTVGDPSTLKNPAPPAALPAVEPRSVWLALAAPRTAAIARVLRGARGPGLIGHLPALAVLFPEGITGPDPIAAGEADATADDKHRGDATLTRASEAIRGIFERLFVKLRIPNYAVTASDLEDAATRRELLALLDLLAAPSSPGADGKPGDLYLRIACERVRALQAALTDAPLGGPETLATVAALLPREGAGATARAIGAYASELAAACADVCALSPDGFAAQLVAQPTPSLDAARAAALDALDALSAVDAQNAMAAP